jgi:hypothetical protein
MSAETWVNILYTYGPFALLIFLVLVVEKQVRSAWREADKNNKPERTLFQVLYGLTWVMIFGVAICGIYAWWVINLSRRPQIIGTAESFPNVEILGTTCADLYLHKKPKGLAYSDYDLLLINTDHKQWPDGEKIKLTIQAPRNGAKDDDLYEYELPIRSDFYKTGVVLRRRANKLLLVNRDKEEELQGGVLPSNALPSGVQASEAAPPSSVRKRTWDLLPTVYAQAQQAQQQGYSTYEFTIGLESPDAIVRRQTRQALARQDQSTAIPFIDSVLKNSASSYRLRLGVLVALNHMPNLRAESLLPATITAIQNTLNDPDDALRNEALGLASRYQLIPVTVFEDANFAGTSQVYGPGIYRADKLRLGSLPNDSASSVHVANGFGVRLCENEGDGNGSGVCETKGPGNHNLLSGPGGVGDKVSFIRVFALEK